MAQNPFFIGRESIISALRQGFQSKRVGARTQAIIGLGGAGKTQVAVEFAYRYHTEYKAVFWTQADTELSLTAGYVAIARLLGLPAGVLSVPEHAVDVVKQWMQANDQWLLIVDNADVPGILKPYLPPNGQGHFLFTSRAQSFDGVGVVRPIQLDLLTPEEAETFLFLRTGRETDNGAEAIAVAALAKNLGYLPLALEQAAAYIRAHQAPFCDYLRSYERHSLTLLERTMPAVGDYPRSVATTWELNIAEVRKSPAAADLIFLSAVLGPDSIPIDLLRLGARELGPTLADSLADVAVDPLVMREVLEPLIRYALIRLDRDADAYSIHRLLQVVVQTGMGEEGENSWKERAVRAMNVTFPDPEFNNWSFCQRLLPQAVVCADLVQKSSMEFGAAGQLLNKVGFYLFRQGQYATAEVLLMEACHVAERAYGTESENAATCSTNLATLYMETKQYPKAEPLYVRAANIARRIASPMVMAMSLNNLATLYDAQGRHHEAEVLYREVLALKRHECGPEHASVATSLNNLGILLKTQKRYAEAEPLFQEALSLRERLLSSNDPDIAGTLINLATLYMEQERLEEARLRYERAKVILEHSLGDEHPTLAACLSGLGIVYQKQDRMAEAELCFQQALTIQEATLGDWHQDTMITLGNYAVMLRQAQRLEEADVAEARACAIYVHHASSAKEQDAP